MSTTGPTNNLVSALLVDLYQVTMTYAHWKAGKHEESGVFELFFRKNPFGGEFTVFCGLDECLKHIDAFSFSEEDVAYLRSTSALAHCDEGFFDYLQKLDTSRLTVRAMREGTIAFPRVPLLIIEAPLGLGQLLETTLLNLVNYPSLVATNAARMVLRANPAPCIEFGLRRAQGPDGACSASKYSYIGGFVATSNLQAGKLFGIPVAGTHAHSYVQAFTSLDEVRELTLFNNHAKEAQLFLPTVLKHRKSLSLSLSTSDPHTHTHTSTNDGELASFVAYACAFPHSCLCLVDTYDTLKSGLPNFSAVALALDDFGYQPKGIRLDSGDLCALSLDCAAYFRQIMESTKRDVFQDITIVASNDINEQILEDLAHRNHAITTFGIGTNLVTCQAQPALGCVYKLVEWNGRPRIKISQEMPKVTIPGSKHAFRIYGHENRPLLDIMCLAGEDAPAVGSTLVCQDPFETHTPFSTVPTKVVDLYTTVFQNSNVLHQESLEMSRDFVKEQIHQMSQDIFKFSKPNSYQVKVSQGLFQCLHNLWEQESCIEERRSKNQA